ncbi:hypothetical protein KO481_39715 [Nocardia sp. NEAU-G5]|uniref:SDR family NAD(P)-dependent oxidoreductase n=1 Tax=Nocardia albiluteola TaxID=2842303 RepID=A0ABS6BCZ6_9NOCA|nr:hypothetical protein [Nocardia albiluteola]MBU3067635.1 hypothetical protein [Nocardia albiluteola]
MVALTTDPRRCAPSRAVSGGRHVTATVRGSGRTPLHELTGTHGERLEIETVDITEPAQIAALRDRLAGRRFDLLFVNAGVTNEPEGTVAETSTEEFTGTIAVMSSGQGSVTNNVNGGHEVYRASIDKAERCSILFRNSAPFSCRARTLPRRRPCARNSMKEAL